jgi:hypothetical protein
MKETNYCGFGKSVFIRPPYWALQNASCEIHDQNYKKGGTEEDRLKADVGFLKHMLMDISVMPYKKKARAAFSACLYYLFVRALGRLTFKYHD